MSGSIGRCLYGTPVLGEQLKSKTVINNAPEIKIIFFINQSTWIYLVNRSYLQQRV